MIRTGTSVKWKWGNGFAKGKVEEVFHSDTTKTINGNKVSREASKEHPAYIIKQEDGQKVLKSSTEVTKA
jgi:hypothetical protein